MLFDDGNIVLNVSVLTLITTSAGYLIYNIIVNLIEKKYGVKPSNKLETFTFLMNELSKQIIELAPVAKDLFRKEVKEFMDSVPVPAPAPSRFDELVDLTSKLMNEFVEVKSDLKTLIDILAAEKTTNTTGKNNSTEKE